MQRTQPPHGDEIQQISDLANNPSTGTKGLLKVSRTTLWRMVKAGDFPPPLNISKGVKGWRLSTVHEWLNQKAGQEVDQ
jgi:predicted DNA-binding transcriptional regulator AlpA